MFLLIIYLILLVVTSIKIIFFELPRYNILNFKLTFFLINIRYIYILVKYNLLILRISFFFYLLIIIFFNFNFLIDSFNVNFIKNIHIYILKKQTAFCMDTECLDYTKKDFNFLEQTYKRSINLSTDINNLKEKPLFFTNKSQYKINIPYDFIYKRIIDVEKEANYKEIRLGGIGEIEKFCSIIDKSKSNRTKLFISIKCLIVQNQIDLNSNLLEYNSINDFNFGVMGQDSLVKKNHIYKIISTLERTTKKNYDILFLIKSHSILDIDKKKQLLLFLKSYIESPRYKGSLRLLNDFLIRLSTYQFHSDIKSESFFKKLSVFQELNLINLDYIVKYSAIGTNPSERDLINTSFYINKFDSIEIFFQNIAENTSLNTEEEESKNSIEEGFNTLDRLLYNDNSDDEHINISSSNNNFSNEDLFFLDKLLE